VSNAQLEFCPECRRPWPAGAEHDLRGLGWLSDLPRGITPSNGDIFIHDGDDGRDRMLAFETKSSHEQWPIRTGQARLLMSMARRPSWIVRVLRGSLEHLVVHRVTPSLIEESGVLVSPIAFRGAIARWLNGMDWGAATRESRRDVPHTAEPLSDLDSPEFHAAWDQIEARMRGGHRDAA
jgi:hypothetical protein